VVLNSLHLLPIAVLIGASSKDFLQQSYWNVRGKLNEENLLFSAPRINIIQHNNPFVYPRVLLQNERNTYIFILID
jgi:hypothetical protein